MVGAGGAGFPTYVKAQAEVEYLLVNGAECEPLLHKDRCVMLEFGAPLLEGIRLLAAATGAREVVVGIKKKNEDVRQSLAELSARTAGLPSLRFLALGDFYPSGDEYELVYEATGRLIPPAGLPLHVGCVVANVETLVNVARAEQGQAVTAKTLTVTGAVAQPGTFTLPLGIALRDVIALAGGPTCSPHGILLGGIMMGAYETDLDRPITRTTNAVIVLPTDHELVRRYAPPRAQMHRIGKSACDQCSYCTELCPRYLLGYDVEPHKVMRTLGFVSTGKELWNLKGQLCCECGVCTLIACPEALFPREACQQAKQDLRAAGIRWQPPGGRPAEVRPHPMHRGRRLPISRIMQRLDLHRFDQPAPYRAVDTGHVRLFRIRFQQHAGAPAAPVVKPGDRVAAGQVIGRPPPDKLGVPIHASVAGIVRAVEAEAILIERNP